MTTIKIGCEIDSIQNNWKDNIKIPLNNEFCTSENIDDCLKYISQELIALGHPNIYSTTGTCIDKINCDVVILLNATFELLRTVQSISISKEDLESRNKRLIGDLQTLNKKHSHLKEFLEQQDNKLKSALEKERQMKVKNEQLTHLLKTEKDESKKLSTQIHQQKTAFQHESRKWESKMNQLTSKLNKILTDKSSEKKIANFNSSHLLQRNARERGKWKTGATAKTKNEEMYSTLIATYENRFQEMCQELLQLHNCFEFIQSQLEEVICHSQHCESENVVNDLQSDSVPLKLLLSKPNNEEKLTQRFATLANNIKVNEMNLINQIASKNNELQDLESKLKNCTNLMETYESKGIIKIDDNLPSEKYDQTSLPCTCSNVIIKKDQHETEIAKLNSEKLKLAEAFAENEKEKVSIESQKVYVMQMLMQQLYPLTQELSSRITVQSFPIITTKLGITSLPSTDSFTKYLYDSNTDIKSLKPLWNMPIIDQEQLEPSSSNDKSMCLPDTTSQVTEDYNTFLASDLPKWASAAIDVHTHENPQRPFVNIEPDLNQNEHSEILDESTNESSLYLQAAVEDIEKRRNLWQS